MTARIIETNSAPFERVEVDTVTVDILENALSNARVEMDAVLFRTAMSPGIREQGDCFPMIANRDGKMVVGQFGSFINGFMQAYEGALEEGDELCSWAQKAIEASLRAKPEAKPRKTRPRQRASAR